MSTSSIIMQAHLQIDNDEASYKDMIKIAPGGVLTPLSYYLDLLKQTDEVLFPYMDKPRKEQLIRELQITYRLLSIQKKYEERRQKTENAAAYEEHRQRCAKLLNFLRDEAYRGEQNTIPAPERGQQTDGCPIKYLARALGQELAKQVAACMNSKTKTIVGAMNAFNEKRLYWVWGSVLLNTVLSLMPDELLHLDQAKEATRTLAPYTGVLSWALYYCRFSFHLGLLLKHTISGPWMHEEEKQIPWTERFKTQWAQRKFSLLNDSLWALTNMLYFLSLNGANNLGAAGDLLTIVLLGFDLTVAVWDFEEQQTEYNKELLAYETQLEQLENDRIDCLSETQIAEEILNYQQKQAQLQQPKNPGKEKTTERLGREKQSDYLAKKIALLVFKQNIPSRIQELEALLASGKKSERTGSTSSSSSASQSSSHTKSLSEDLSEQERADIANELTILKRRQEIQSLDNEDSFKKMQGYAARAHSLEQAKARCTRDWTYKKIHLINNITYAVGLLIAYALLTTPFLPIAAPTVAAIGLAGAIMCFSFTVINNAIKGGIDLHKEYVTGKEAVRDYQDKVGRLQDLFVTNTNPDEPAKKLIYLEIQQALAHKEYQHQLVQLKTAHLIRSVFIESIIPALIFVNLVFLPMGMGLGVIGGLIALAIFSKFVVDKLFEAEKKSLGAFDEREYRTFCNTKCQMNLPVPESSEEEGLNRYSFARRPTENLGGGESDDPSYSHN